MGTRYSGKGLVWQGDVIHCSLTRVWGRYRDIIH